MAILTDISEGSSSSKHDEQHQKYDVFLSFRGEDTRLNFTNHLHKALLHTDLETFLDDEELYTGVYLKPELESAIKASRASIIVLSKNYASSTWCLDELVLILDQHRTCGHIVIPIFYHVEPTDVRKQQNTFKDAMDKHKQRMEAETDVEKKSTLAEKIEKWKEALTQVADLKGQDAKGRLETEFIEEIVDDIYRRLGAPIRSSLPQLIGVDESVDFITSWLKDEVSDTVEILTIWGISGIGKTSLASYVFKLHRREFDTSSFIEDISRMCGQSNGILGLQKQHLGNILKSDPVQVHCVSDYTSKIQKALTGKKVFLVLDDIDSLDQLDVLLGNKSLHPGSKIIITAKGGSLTETCALFKLPVQPKHTKHLLEGLFGWSASLRLLCHHAFKCKKVKECYGQVLDDIVKYCGGHPLALKVLGSSLHEKDLAYWEECINELKKGPEGLVSSINNVLRICFLSLSSNDRELFKHIACFFVGIDRHYAETILKACKIQTTSGITNLIDRCLLHIGRGNELRMHSLIQEMGRYEVHQESPKREERSRLWHHEDSLKVLKKKKGTGAIIGLTLDSIMIEEEELRGSLLELETDAFSKMNKLKLLQLNHVQLNGSCENFPKKLRWLCMHWYPLQSMPLDLPMKKLVCLDMSYSNIKSFQMSCSNHQRLGNSQKQFGCLKILNLSHCYQLHSLGGFSQFPALESLFLAKCTSLVEVCKTIEQCHELFLVDLRYCSKSDKLLRNLDILKKVKTLLLDGCNLGEPLSETRNMDSLKTVNANSISINSQKTSSSAIVKAIPRSFKSRVVSFPSSLALLSLANNNLSCESFPLDLSLSTLECLILSDNPIVSLPNFVKSLPRLERLVMRNCKMLRSIEHPPRTLKLLHCEVKGNSLRKIVFDQEMSPLKLHFEFPLFEVNKVVPFEYEGILKIQLMAGVEKSVLRSLGWSNLEFIKKCKLMHFEFGIFSTWYTGKEMPKWIRHRSKGSSISFTLPSSPKQLTGLNFCHVQMISDKSEKTYCWLPLIKICNVTKNLTWRYESHIRLNDNVGEKWLTFISHWMFGMNDMEGGDRVTIDVYHDLVEPIHQRTKKCGVRVVYDDRSMEEEEEGALDYYRSWNHILGGDLSPFDEEEGELDSYRSFNRILGGDLPPFAGKTRHSYYLNGTGEFEGRVKIQSMKDVEKSVLRSLGWNLEFTKKWACTQMYYEFGIFSTMYGGKEMPEWIRRRNKGSSISFMLPVEAPKKKNKKTKKKKQLIGLNFCYVQMLSYRSGYPNFRLPKIIISNLTKKLTWTYTHYILGDVNVGGKWLTFISHWMFGMNDMEGGDRVTIYVLDWPGQVTKKCGVRVVYDDRSMEEEEEEEEEDDVLDYYRSWNHILGGDLSPFEEKTGHSYYLDGNYDRKIPGWVSSVVNPWKKAHVRITNENVSHLT